MASRNVQQLQQLKFQLDSEPRSEVSGQVRWVWMCVFFVYLGLLVSIPLFIFVVRIFLYPPIFYTKIIISWDKMEKKLSMKISR